MSFGCYNDDWTVCDVIVFRCYNDDWTEFDVLFSRFDDWTVFDVICWMLI